MARKKQFPMTSANESPLWPEEHPEDTIIMRDGTTRTAS